MKIAEVTSTFPPYKAGMGNVVYYNAWALTTLGHEVTVFTTKYKNSTNHSDEYPFEVQRLGAWFKYGNAGILPQLFYKLPKYYINRLDLVEKEIITLFEGKKPRQRSLESFA